MSKHCLDCTETSFCGNYHVYVIELKKKVLEKEPGFPFEGELPRDKRVYYVGETSHSPECRYKQHVADREKKSRKGFMCNCFTDEPKFRPFKSANGPGKYVFEYHKKGCLRPELYRDENPVTKNEGNYPGMMKNLKDKSVKKEEELALKLQSMGHAVHYG